MVPKVTYTDEGTYTQRDFWNNEIATVKVAVTRELSFFSVDDNNFYCDSLVKPEVPDLYRCTLGTTTQTHLETNYQNYYQSTGGLA